MANRNAGPGYFEMVYEAPFKGQHSNLPENKIPKEYTPNASNWIVRGGELRTRPRQSQLLPGLPDGSQITGHTAFVDSNNVVHTVVVSTTGLWQLNSRWNSNNRKNLKNTWSLVGNFPAAAYPAPLTPAQMQVYITKVFFVNGSQFLWQWDGITPNSLNATIAPTNVGIYDVANGLNAGSYFLGELDNRLIMLNTIEQQNVSGKPATNFGQRVRWSASGLPTVWDATVNVGAGFNDEIDVPDTINGFMSIGRTGFVFRVNGITEMTSISSSLLPFDFNHLWASDRGIGNVYPFSIANYGPVGIYIATDDIYELSLGGFKKIGGVNRNQLYVDLYNATASPIASMFPAIRGDYPYLVYMLSIPHSNMCTNWMYYVEDEAWVRWTQSHGFVSGKARMVPTN